MVGNDAGEGAGEGTTERELPFVVVGTGPVARELGRVLARDGGRCVAVLSRRLDAAREVAAYLGAGLATTCPEELPAEARAVLVAVADDAIVDVARRLGVAGVARGRTLIHFAGSLSAEAMRLPETAGAALASIHPLRHFDLASVDPTTFPGTFCAIDGDPEVTAALAARVRAAGGVPFDVRSEAKGLYMAGVLVPITLMPALIAEAERALEIAGVAPEARRALVAHLVARKAQEIAARPAAEALHGPLAHGDVPVMTRVIDAVARLHPALLGSYRALADRTLARALERGLLSGSRAQAMRAALGLDGA